MKHAKTDCSPWNIVIAGDRIQCGDCLAIEDTEWHLMPHDEKYRALNKAVGIALSGIFMGRTAEQWKQLLDDDADLNNVPLQLWEMKATAFLARTRLNPLRPRFNLSLAEMVCAYKQAVEDMVAREVLFQPKKAVDNLI